jgi:hypothetical protein
MRFAVDAMVPKDVYRMIHDRPTACALELMK